MKFNGLVMKIPMLSNLLSRSDQRVGWFAICTSSRGVHFAQVKQGGSKPKVQVCTFHSMAEVGPDALEKLRKGARIPNFQFITLLSPGEYQLLLVDAPNVPLGEMKTAIRWRIKDALSYHVDDATVDVLRIPGAVGGVERPLSLYAVAVPNDIIKKRIALFEKARIDLKVIDIPEMAQRNMAALFEQPGQALALLAFTDHGALLTFTCDGELYLSRHIEVTLDQLQNPDASQRQQNMERLLLEVGRSMDYFSRQYSYVPLQRLLVFAPDDARLIPELTPNLDVPVEPVDLAQVLDTSAVPKLGNSEFARHAFYALGAALRQERRVL
jgi:MSHA biogenesis protein MshI